MGINTKRDYTLGVGLMPSRNICIITGACRSGKTTLGNLLATASNVENFEEPWTSMTLPIAAGLGLIEKGVAMDLFSAGISELINDAILLRYANFRPGDLSSIYRKKSAEEIFDRLTNLKSREDVAQYIEKNNPLFLLNLPEISPFIDFFEGSHVEPKIIIVVRSPGAVAADLVDKNWFSDEQLKKPKNQIYYRKILHCSGEFYLPWWVKPNQDDFFLSLSELDRGAYYWCEMVGESLCSLARFNKPENVSVVHYETIVSNPEKVFEKMASWFSFHETPLTKLAVAEIESFQSHEDRVEFHEPIILDRIEWVRSQLPDDNLF
jgi:hypothetical protein